METRENKLFLSTSNLFSSSFFQLSFSHAAFVCHYDLLGTIESSRSPSPNYRLLSETSGDRTGIRSYRAVGRKERKSRWERQVRNMEEKRREEKSSEEKRREEKRREEKRREEKRSEVK